MGKTYLSYYLIILIVRVGKARCLGEIKEKSVKGDMLHSLKYNW